ncbi:MscS Mechanosensitive ion channel [Hydrogenobacter thermophilus TK-6]|uniref:Mechanosensitive ion channel n=1 Tax=Hydrogenobacter thermophilus (strain DSM 6534 / IAM 12695 / TK-6) TaxID=608538 RepID=D3DJ49_HYDTT|nr:mechanosensitive ion channel family protein [Hydrogenobacter thermophilus]ADO45775.1 MscS Mechanosensitive ion channel [Hydrogenobacter thermophilus TK-6]BAI69851.1 mechanosensitive ion channel [Hydrogenobacter thermophilus TK-6]
MMDFYLPVLVFFLSFFVFLSLRLVFFSFIKRFLQRLSLFGVLHRTLRIPTLLWVLALSLYLALYFSEELQKHRKYFHLIEKIIEGLLILSITLVIADVIVEIIRFYVRKSNISLPPTALIFALIKGIIIALGVITLLSSFGVPVAHFITTLGIGALAVSLALQGTLSNFFSGLNIIASRQIEVGDFIRLESGQEGYVQDITWMNTVIRQRDNNLVIVPNSRLVSSIITNHRKPEPSMALVIPIGVSYSSDLEKVERVTLEVAKEVQRSVEGADPSFEPFIRYSAFGDFSINFSVILRVLDTDAQFLVKHEFIKRIKEAYEKEGIEIPFPVRKIYLYYGEGGA